MVCPPPLLPSVSQVRVLPLCDEILGLLLKNLQNPQLNRNVKPPILSCFGDVALAIGGHYEKYMQATMNMLAQASLTTVNMEDEDLAEYLFQLQEGIFEAYTGVLQARPAPLAPPRAVRPRVRVRCVR